MAIYVLTHGSRMAAWGSGRVAPLLEAYNHRVIAPVYYTLPGHVDRHWHPTGGTS